MFGFNNNQEQQQQEQANNPAASAQRSTTINIQPNRYDNLHQAAISLGVSGLGTIVYGSLTEANKEVIKDGINIATRKAGIGDVFTPGSADSGKVEKPKTDSTQLVPSQSTADIDGGVVTKQGTFKDGEKTAEINFYDSTGKAKAKVDLARVEADERLEKQRMEAKEREDLRQNELAKERIQLNERNAIRGVGVGLMGAATALELTRAVLQRQDANQILAAQTNAVSRQDQVYAEMDRICSESEANYNNLIQRNEQVTIEELEHLRTEFQTHLPHFQALPNDIGRPGCMRCNAKINQINSRIAGISARNQRTQQEAADNQASREEQQRTLQMRVNEFNARIDELINADESIDLQPAVETLQNEIQAFREQNPAFMFQLNTSQNLQRLVSIVNRNADRERNIFS
jgi:hypothetical protein